MMMNATKIILLSAIFFQTFADVDYCEPNTPTVSKSFPGFEESHATFFTDYSPVKKPGNGGLCKAKYFTVSHDSVTVYRVFGEGINLELGSWWSLEDPSSLTKEEFYQKDDLCVEWDPNKYRYVSCHLKIGTKVAIGPGQAAKCSNGMTIKQSNAMQVYINAAHDVSMFTECSHPMVWSKQLRATHSSETFTYDKTFETKSDEKWTNLEGKLELEETSYIMNTLKKHNVDNKHENSLSDSSEEKVGGSYSWAHNALYGTWTEVDAPQNAPLVNLRAMQVAQMAAPIVNLAYIWRSNPVERTEEEQEQVKEAQKWIVNFPDEPGVVLTKAAGYDTMAYASKGTIPDFAGKGAKRKAVIVGFPGTETLNDVIADIKAATRTDWKKVNGKQWQVASGFLQRYKDHMKEEDFEGQLLKYVKSEKPEYIYVVGHSLGGAVSAVCGADLATREEYKDYKIVVITFGQPRAFGYETATEINNLFKPGNTNGNEYWRIMQYGDVIPDLPDTNIGFEHAGRPFDLNKKNPITGSGKWEFQERRQDWSPHVIGTSLAGTHCTAAGQWSTHFMKEYACRLGKLHDQVVKDGLLPKTQSEDSAETNVLTYIALNNYVITPLAMFGVFVVVYQAIKYVHEKHASQFTRIADGEIEEC